MVKAVIHKNGRILGASILAPMAGEIIQTWILAIDNRQKICQPCNHDRAISHLWRGRQNAAGNFFYSQIIWQNDAKIGADSLTPDRLPARSFDLVKFRQDC